MERSVSVRYTASRGRGEQAPPRARDRNCARSARSRRALFRAPVYALIGALIGIALLAPAAAAANTEASFQHNPLLDPPIINGQPVKVAVELHIANVAGISSVHQDFRLQAYLYETWRDPRLAYTADAPSRNLNLGAIWLPKLIVINAVEPRQVFGRAASVTPAGVVHYVERFTVLASSKFRLRSFPFDSQKLQIIV
ncbi:MAG: hypothetical protein ACREP6_04385, partial [Candidatus Binataceae bacterium]